MAPGGVGQRASEHAHKGGTEKLGVNATAVALSLLFLRSDGFLEALWRLSSKWRVKPRRNGEGNGHGKCGRQGFEDEPEGTIPEARKECFQAVRYKRWTRTTTGLQSEKACARHTKRQQQRLRAHRMLSKDATTTKTLLGKSSSAESYFCGVRVDEVA